jgi:hypothetical protein
MRRTVMSQVRGVATIFESSFARRALPCLADSRMNEAEPSLPESCSMLPSTLDRRVILGQGVSLLGLRSMLLKNANYLRTHAHRTTFDERREMIPNWFST